MAPVAKVVRESSAGLCNRGKTSSVRVEASFAAPTPGKVIPQENSRLFTEEEGKGKAADGIEMRRCLRHRIPCPQFHSEQWLHK